jgi:hypothetical protein
VNDESRERLTTAKVEVPEHIVYREFPLETVVLNVSTGQYHGLNPMASVILDHLQGSTSVGAAIEQLTLEYDAPPDQLRDDVVELCQRMLERGLITVVAADQ